MPRPSTLATINEAGEESGADMIEMTPMRRSSTGKSEIDTRVSVHANMATCQVHMPLAGADSGASLGITRADSPGPSNVIPSKTGYLRRRKVKTTPL